MQAALSQQGFFSAYSGGWIIGYFLMGVILYTIDRTWLQGTYRSLYNLTHENPLDKPKGFIFGQKVSRKVLIAGIISTVESFGFLLFTTFNSHLSVELFLWLIDIPVMVLGFAAGFSLFPLWSKRKKAYEFADRLDATLEQRLSKPDSGSTPPPVAKPADPVPTPVVAPVVPVNPEISPEQRISDYAKR